MKHIITILKFLIKNWIILLSSLAAIFSLVFFHPNPNPEVIFLNIGQGDAILIQQGSFQILVDTGPDDSILYELPKYMPSNDYTIEIILLTHSHDDHIQGLFSILNNYEVENIFYQSKCFESSDFNYIKINYSSMLHDLTDPFEIKYGDIDIKVIYPFEVDCHDDVNQDSIVSELKIYDTKVLLMGDAGFEAEDYLLKNNELSQIDILKAGHHCSRSATSDMFLMTVFPTVSICSCGEGNTFGHPHSETIEKFRKYNVQYLVTYKTGNIVFKFKKP